MVACVSLQTSSLSGSALRIARPPFAWRRPSALRRAGNTFTQQRVISLRHAHDISVFATAPDGTATLTIEEAARILGVSTTTVRRLIVGGWLPAKQPVPNAPWAIEPNHLHDEAIQRAVAAVKAGRHLPQLRPKRS
jgi:Helix-turn-helix domain